MTQTYLRRTARVVVLDASGRVLLLRMARLVAGEPVSYSWFTPGGGVQPGEDLATAAARELREETGLAAGGELRYVAYTYGLASWLGTSGQLRDDFFLYRAAGQQVDTAGLTPFERDHYGGHRWWTQPELCATTEVIYPAGLAGLLADLTAGSIPPGPVRLPYRAQPPVPPGSSPRPL